ncbi:MAG TPA: hypothetical protein VHX40_01620, partial [Acidimicrobiales bacterium]|nr:hypothetical protein [Acidimicrobiales bacterium]
VIASHSQMDHFGGLLNILEMVGDRFAGELHFNQDSMLAMPVASDREKNLAGKRLRALLHRARQYGERLRHATPTSSPVVVGSLSVDILSPTPYEVVTAVATNDPNLASAVVVLRTEGRSIVLGADAQMSTWERIADQLPKGAIVRWPHHGGSIGPAGSHARLIAILEPTDVLVSVGATNSYGHPSTEFFTAAQSMPAVLRCTQATSTCAAGGGRLGPCAGAIRVEFSGRNGTLITTEVADHDERIEALGNAQCRRRPDREGSRAD